MDREGVLPIRTRAFYRHTLDCGAMFAISLGCLVHELGGFVSNVLAVARVEARNQPQEAYALEVLTGGRYAELFADQPEAVFDQPPRPAGAEVIGYLLDRLGADQWLDELCQLGAEHPRAMTKARALPKMALDVGEALHFNLKL